VAAGPALVGRADPRHEATAAGGKRRRDPRGAVRDEVPDLDAMAAQIGVRGNRYNDLHMGLVAG
jgi:hypothetical protein